MPDRNAPYPRQPDQNPLGLGPRDRESSNTVSIAHTSYAAQGYDPYTTGEPHKRFDDRSGAGSTPADPDVPSSDEP